jgi:hypothetical protein
VGRHLAFRLLADFESAVAQAGALPGARESGGN